MENHAIALLRNERLWEEVGLTKYEANHPGLVTRFLLHLITESQALGGSFLSEFWMSVGMCHPTLRENVAKLSAAPELVSENDLSAVLFNGVPTKKFNYAPVFLLAGEYFTHLGLTFMQPRDPEEPDRYDIGTDRDPPSGVAGCEGPGLQADELDLKMKLDTQEVGLTKKQILEYSVFNRDGFNCVITSSPLQYPLRLQLYTGAQPSLILGLNCERNGSNLTPIIPLIIEKNPSAQRCIASLAGDHARQLVLNHLFTVNNAMVLAFTARCKFDEMLWAVEALDSAKYVLRIPGGQVLDPLYFKLRDGDEINFGLGQDGEGPLPELCNLRLAVARALRLSGAARLIGALIDDFDVDTSRDCQDTAPSSFYLQLACHLPDYVFDELNV